jgi:hypothetical protein
MDDKKVSVLSGEDIASSMQEASDQYDQKAEEYWKSLSYEDQLQAFYIVTKRIHKGDIVEKGSYRHVLYDTFGFDFDSYIIGLDSGYLDIHNGLVTNEI